MTTYTKVARKGDIARGRMMRVEVDGKPILVVNLDDKFYAVCDICPHEDASLSTGALQGDLVRCPLHGSRFNLKTGAVLEEPAEEDLTTYTVRIDGEDILVGPPCG